MFFGIRIEFILFALVLLGVALFHHKTFYVAVTGLVVILSYKFIFDGGFQFVEHMIGSNPFFEQIIDKHTRQGEWSILLNLFGLLIGFAILAKIFEESGIPEILPKYLPNDWKGPFVLLIMVFIISSFLDNIAAALIGGTIALVVFKGNLHIGFLAAIVGASNAGGAGSVVGDTTTTMMWIDGVSPLQVFHGYIAASVALVFMAWFAAKQQDKFQPIQKDAPVGAKVDFGKLLIVAMILVGAILTNFYFDLPALGVWVAIILGAIFRPIPWKEIPGSLMGTIFLLSLVMCASLMPVETLPDASWVTAFILGFVSAVFDNIPLTKLCLEQGHYDWGMLAYSVGFGGSMIWFGSSAGVALTNKFPEGRNVMLWIKKGWFVTVAYIIGFFVLLFVWGWHPSDNKKHKEPAANCPIENCKAKKDALGIDTE
ncbi:MAG: citrate transporter [Bacteroidetes bacterium GWA2_30_7]|nr:MAG: citrate transporter [Bacteroidetes bacterium GWA2_30_7]